MAYVKYSGLTKPNEVLEKMADYVKGKGYTVVQDYTDDANIYDRSTVDGKKFVFQDKTNTYFISLRSANGTYIFGTSDDAQMDTLPADKYVHYSGIGMVVSEGYSKSQRWYNQFNAPHTLNAKDVQGVFMPVTAGTAIAPVTRPSRVSYPNVTVDQQFIDDTARYNQYVKDTDTYVNYLGDEDNYIEYLKNRYNTSYRYDLFCNEVTKPTATLTFSLVKQSVQIVDKIADPPVRPVRPPRPVKQPYPAQPTAPIKYNVATSNYGLFDSAGGDYNIGIGDMSTAKSKIDNINNKDNLSVNLHPLFKVIDNSGVITNICAQLNQSTGHTFEPFTDNANNFLMSAIDTTVTVPKVTITSCTLTANQFYNYSAYYYNYAYAQNGVSPYDVDNQNIAYHRQCSSHDIQGTFERNGNSVALSNVHIVLIPTDVVVPKLQNFFNEEFGYKRKEGFDNKTSADWVAYNTTKKQIDDKYDADMKQHLTDLQKFDSDMKVYEPAFEKYVDDLEKGIGITYKEDPNTKLFQCTHLIVGNLEKYDKWTGGIYFSGSANRDMLKTCWQVYEDNDTSDQWILPVLSSSSKTNTFLRIDIDDAPMDERGHILWASSGTDNVTGKKLSLPIRVVGDSGNGKIPHYQYLQSQERLDWGRNINTLNCITINMPIYFSILVDPDVMDLYACCGAASGIYFISTLNTQTSYTYEIQYPDSNILCETFPMGKRRGHYGFDGISIYQEDSPPLKPVAPLKPTAVKPQEVAKPDVVDKPQVVTKPTEPTAVEEPAVVELNDIDIPYVPINNDGSRPQGVSISSINNIKQLKSDGDIFV